MGFPGGAVVKNPSANAGDVGLIPGLGSSPGEGSGNTLWYSCLGNPLDRGAGPMIVPDVAKNWTLLSNQRTITTPRENGVDMNIKEYYPQTTPPPVNIPPLHFCDANDLDSEGPISLSSKPRMLRWWLKVHGLQRSLCPWAPGQLE